MKAIILTAGEGTRMRPLTTTRPKTMLITGGKPLIQYNIESLRDAGIKAAFSFAAPEKASDIQYIIEQLGYACEK